MTAKTKQQKRREAVLRLEASVTALSRFHPGEITRELIQKRRDEAARLRAAFPQDWS